jgi:hypothetical protein
MQCGALGSRAAAGGVCQGSKHDRISVARWFETRGVAALLTMRVLILRSALLARVSKDEATMISARREKRSAGVSDRALRHHLDQIGAIG